MEQNLDKGGIEKNTSKDTILAVVLPSVTKTK